MTTTENLTFDPIEFARQALEDTTEQEQQDLQAQEQERRVRVRQTRTQTRPDWKAPSAKIISGLVWAAALFAAFMFGGVMGTAIASTDEERLESEVRIYKELWESTLEGQ